MAYVGAPSFRLLLAKGWDRRISLGIAKLLSRKMLRANVFKPAVFRAGYETQRSLGAGAPQNETKFSNCGLALPQHVGQLSAGDQVGNPAEIIRQNAVFFDRRRDGANGIVRALGALSGLEGGAEVERLRRC